MNVKNHYSLDAIAQRKAEVTAELDQTKGKIESLTRAIIAPPKNKSNAELWMHYASNGMSTFKGIVTVIKTYRRIRETFKKKKQKDYFSWL